MPRENMMSKDKEYVDNLVIDCKELYNELPTGLMIPIDRMPEEYLGKSKVKYDDTDVAIMVGMPGSEYVVFTRG